MAWIRLDDHITRHPKILQCTPTACWLYVSCISHANEMLTNGFVGDRELSFISHVRRPRAAAEALVRSGLLERVDEPTRKGYQIHDYLDFNDSKEVVLQKRKALSEIRAKSGRNGAMAKWQKTWQTQQQPPPGKQAENGSSPIPSHPSKNPPTPLSAKGGRVTRKELAHARAVLGKRFGRCQHEPECANPEDCVRAIAADRKRR